MDEVTTIISTVGFPIFCVLALGWFVYKAYNNISINNKDREEKLYTMLGKTQEQLDKAQSTNAKFMAVLEDFKRDTETIKTDIEQIKKDIKHLPKRKCDISEEGDVTNE